MLINYSGRTNPCRRYNYYIALCFFHGIRFKVKDSSAVVRQPIFFFIWNYGPF